MSFEPDQIFVNNTLSTLTIPGEDKLYQNTNTESIFTFGDFRIERNINSNTLLSDIKPLSFDRFQNLTSLTSSDFNATKAIGLTENDLNPDLTDPNSYSYFGSFYTKLANSINKIIAEYPYAILTYDSNVGETNFITLSSTQLSYTEITLISSAFTNQGNIIFTSGNSYNVLSANTLTIFDNFNQFELQLSSTTLNTTPAFPILSYNYSAYSNYYHLNFRISGIFTANTTDAIYIRPSKKRYFEYKRSLGNLEYQLLEGGKWLVPNPNNDQFFEKSIPWPRSIDGFAPDSYGTNFDNFTDELLTYATLTDQLKTNWMVRTIVPENFLELDTDGQIYNKLIQTYAEEFDKIKEYIDNLAYSHSYNYTETQTVSNKFLGRLTELLGWKQPINFTDTDFFDFLGQEDDNNKTPEDYNLDLWRRMLTNINWLYKRKGTREAITFIFKLIGAPEALVNFNEFVYKIEKNGSTLLSKLGDQTVGTSTVFFRPEPQNSINENGYINYDESRFIFQEGGPGRGNGESYINQWRPEFDPVRTVDNIKIHTGDSEFFGTENIINSKEISIGLDPASAIEYDTFEWYQLGFFYTGNTTVNLPSDYKLSDVNLVAPPEISGWTISEWLNFVYNNNIDVRTRKTSFGPHHNYFYPNLRKIYLTYYYWNVTSPSVEISSQITFRKLENFLKLVESKFYTYVEQVIPATSIFEGVSTIYRNTVFNRQKFVYPKGINDGSEFQTALPDDLYSQINGVVVTSKVNNIFKSNINGVVVSSKLNDVTKLNFSTVQTQMQVNTIFQPVVNTFNVSSNILSAVTQSQQKVGFRGTIIVFPLSGTPTAAPPSTPQPYTGNTGGGGTYGPQPVNPIIAD
jgi:hypothetical protein